MSPEQRQDFDEAWIAKYRTALNSAAVPRSRAQKFRELFGSAYDMFGKVLVYWTSEAPQDKRTPTPRKRSANDATASAKITVEPSPKQEVRKAS